MNRLVVLLFFVGLVLIGACEKEIELDLPNEKRLVLLSNFSPDSLFRVSLSTTLPIGKTGNQFPDYPEDASIQLFENDHYIDDLIFKPGDVFTLPSYVLNFKPKTKNNYSIKATFSDYPAITSSNRIPSAVEIEELRDVEVYSSEVSPGFFFYNVIANLSIEDKADTLQYFHLLGWQKFEENLESISIYTLDDLGVIVLHEDGFLFNSDDLPVNSKSLNIGLRFVYNANIQTKSPIYIELRNVSEDYFRFHESVGEQEFSAENNQSVLSTEAYFIYNNIDGGIGNFSAYSSSLDSLAY